MDGTINIADMRLFAGLAQADSFTAAARALGVPKQTLSRRIAALEAALGVQLLHRTTRRIRLTDVGAAYGERCAEIVRLADEANRAAADAQAKPSGRLRVTADQVFGEAFVSDLVIDYARRYPGVGVDVVLTRRRVDLIEEGFDVAFRIGGDAEPPLSGVPLGPARIRYCASPDYLSRHGEPADPEALGDHHCIVVSEDSAAVNWPFRGRHGVRLAAVDGRLRFSSLRMARDAAVAGLGIGIFPEFACAADIAAGRLSSVLDAHAVEVGSVWILTPLRRIASARVTAFIALAIDRFRARPPWLVERA